MNAKTEKYFNHKNGGYFMAIIEEMNDLLSQVQEKYDQVCMQRDHLQKRLMEFNAEEEELELVRQYTFAVRSAGSKRI